MRATIIILTLAATAAVARPAYSDTGTGALIVTGSADTREQELATKAASDTLAKADWQLLEKPLTKADASAVTRCFKETEPQRCMLHVVQGRGAQKLAYVSVDPDPSKGERVVKLTGRMVAASIDMVIVANRFCEHCTDDTLSSNAAELTKTLLDRVALTSGRTVLAVKTSPQGARYSVDGAFVGVTDALIDVTPGSHTVTVELDGFQTSSRSIDAAEGKTAEVSITLRRSGPATNGDSKPDGSTASQDDHGSGERHAPFIAKALLVVGGLAIVGGGVSLFFDEDAATTPKTQQYYYDTATPGLITIGAGVVLTAIGGYLFVTHKHATTTAAVTPTGGGAVMTLSGAF